MTKLTYTQLIVLSKAAAREGGLATVPNKMNKAAASKVGASLVAAGAVIGASSLTRLKTSQCEPVFYECEPVSASRIPVNPEIGKSALETGRLK
jgi:hypothetical protein